MKSPARRSGNPFPGTAQQGTPVSLSLQGGQYRSGAWFMACVAGLALTLGSPTVSAYDVEQEAHAVIAADQLKQDREHIAAHEIADASGCAPVFSAAPEAGAVSTTWLAAWYGSGGTSAETFNVTLWRQICAANASQTYLMARITPTSSKPPFVCSSSFSLAQGGTTYAVKFAQSTGSSLCTQVTAATTVQVTYWLQDPPFDFAKAVTLTHKGYDTTTSGSLGDYTAPAPVVTATAIEYFHANFGHYFITASSEEANALDTGKMAGWARTGQTFKVYALNTSGASNVCRFFSTSFAPKSSHFYTPSAQECTIVKSNLNWQYEGLVFSLAPTIGGSCAAGLVPLYRLYNNGQSGAPNHRYTISSSIASTMTAQGWVSEGIISCVPH